ncbi:peptidase M14 [Maribacter sp. ACAM166]|nr:peptidase M14 [Maribacter sp. ACAM166]
MQEEIDYSKIHVSEIQGRYVTYDHLKVFISSLPPMFSVENIGTSVRGEAIKSITYGFGPKRILMWSQMHGNESTTTKAVLDLLNYLKEDNHDITEIATSCTLKIIPILNPDGARGYTRINANKVDLNRDAQDLTQPESRILKKEFEEFKPDFCFNLHDQRTIFNVGTTNKPATVSFLAPAFDMERNSSPSRKISMQLIAAMNSKLQKLIPNQVGRYDDGFNSNCVGDAFQMRETPTLLFEAGHYKEDYEREKTRELIFHALLKGIETIISDSLDDYTVNDYLSIPENGKQYVDILVKNSHKLKPSLSSNQIIYIHYKEVFKDGKVVFSPEILNFDAMPLDIFGHKMLNCDNSIDMNWLKENEILALLY